MKSSISIAVGAAVTLGLIVGNQAGTSSAAGDVGRSVDDLVALLPDGQAVAVTDFVAARAALALGADANPTIDEGPDEQALRRLGRAAILSDPLPYDGHDPAATAIDHGQVTAAATVNMAEGSDVWQVTLIATPQPFDEIAAALEEAGYVRDGDVLAYDEFTLDEANELPPGVLYETIVGGDGVVALAQSGPSGMGAAATLLGDIVVGDAGEEGMAAAVVASLTAPTRLGVASSDPDAPCVQGIGLGDHLDGTGELLIRPDGDADVAAGAVDGDEIGSATLSAPIADGGDLRYATAGDGNLVFVGNTLAAHWESLAADLYRC